LTKVKVIGAYVDGNGPGSIIELSDKQADHLEKVGYVEKVMEQEKPKPKQNSNQKSKK